jgi:hypothetical protein
MPTKEIIEKHLAFLSTDDTQKKISNLIQKARNNPNNKDHICLQSYLSIHDKITIAEIEIAAKPRLSAETQADVHSLIEAQKIKDFLICVFTSYLTYKHFTENESDTTSSITGLFTALIRKSTAALFSPDVNFNKPVSLIEINSFIEDLVHAKKVNIRFSLSAEAAYSLPATPSEETGVSHVFGTSPEERDREITITPAAEALTHDTEDFKSPPQTG